MAHAMNVAMSVGLALAAILGAYLFVLWYASAGVIEQHEDRIADLEKWRAEQFGGPGDVAEAEEGAIVEDEARPGFVRAGQYHVPIEPLGFSEPDTDEFPAVPDTEPDGIAIQVQSALIEQRPSPAPRKAEMVERTVNIGGTLQTFRIPANREGVA
jgi:hypothetical protein